MHSVYRETVSLTAVVFCVCVCVFVCVRAQEEKELFMKRKAEIGIDGQWGIFSMAIPGRVGYQCANFYRHAVHLVYKQRDLILLTACCVCD